MSLPEDGDPTAQLTMAAMALGTGVKVAGQVGSSRAQAAGLQSNANFQASATRASAQPALATQQAAEYNAAIAGQQAQQTLEQGAEEERRFRFNTQFELADIAGEAAAHGVQVSGSTADVLAGAAANAELNALTIRHKSVVQAQSFLNAQTMDQFQAQVAASQAKYIQSQADAIQARGPAGADAARDAGNLNALGTILGAVPKLMDAAPVGGRKLLDPSNLEIQDTPATAAPAEQFNDVNAGEASDLA